MTDPTETDAARRLRERMDGDYEVPVLTEPDGGPVPQWRPMPEDAATDT